MGGCETGALDWDARLVTVMSMDLPKVRSGTSVVVGPHAEWDAITVFDGKFVCVKADIGENWIYDPRTNTWELATPNVSPSGQ